METADQETRLHFLNAKFLLLVVDDSPTIRSMIKGAFDDFYEIVEVQNGIEALNFLKERKPDIIMTDLEMPQLSGFDLIRQIQSSQKWKDIPILVLSQFGQEDNRIKALEDGALDFVPKPFNPRELKARADRAIKRMLEQRQLKEQIGNVLKLLEEKDSILAMRREELVESYKNLQEELRQQGALTKQLVAAEKTIRESEERFKHLVQALPNIFYRQRFDTGTYDYISPQVEKFTGLSANEVIAMGRDQFLNMIVHPDSRRELGSSMEKYRQSQTWQTPESEQQGFRTEFKIVAQDGRVLDVEDISIPWVNDDGKVVGSIGIVLDLTERKREQEEKFKIDHELKLANKIQMSLLPQKDPEIEGYDITGANIPAREVSGDYYDFFSTSDGRLSIVLSDVLGKGVPAAIIMTMVRMLMRSECAKNTAPGDIMSNTNRALMDDISNTTLVTTILMQLDTQKNEIRFVNSGHNPGVMVESDGTIRLLESSAPPLGIVQSSIFDPMVQEERFFIPEGASVILYTDGVIEAVNSQDKEFGFSNLIKTIIKSRRLHGRALMNVVLKEVREFSAGKPAYDDITMVVISRKKAQLIN